MNTISVWVASFKQKKGVGGKAVEVAFFFKRQKATKKKQLRRLLNASRRREDPNREEREGYNALFLPIIERNENKQL